MITSQSFCVFSHTRTQTNITKNKVMIAQNSTSGAQTPPPLFSALHNAEMFPAQHCLLCSETHLSQFGHECITFTTLVFVKSASASCSWGCKSSTTTHCLLYPLKDHRVARHYILYIPVTALPFELLYFEGHVSNNELGGFT